METQSLGFFSRADIEPFVDPAVELVNGYEIVIVTYLTGPELELATATVTLPYDAPAPPAGGWPIVVNAHGTIGLDDPCRLSGTVSGTGLAALFGGRGAIGVAPDYPGLGSPGLHRYLDGQSEGTSTLDAARAAIALADLRAVPTDRRVALVGLSQGGHAVLWAGALRAEWAPELDVRAIAASGPASLFEEQWRSGVTVGGPHLIQHAMLVWSLFRTAGVDDAGVWARGWADLVDDRMTTRCTWSPSFLAEPLLGDGAPTEPDGVFSAGFLAEYAPGAWDRFALVGDGFAANRVRAFGDTVPVAIWQGEADTTVLPWMTEALVDELRAGGTPVELHLVPGGTHVDTAFGFLATPELATDESVAWVFSHLRPPAEE